MMFYFGCGRIEEGRWSGSPDDLMWYADEGDAQWSQVTDEIRRQACRKRTSKVTDVKPGVDLFSKKKGGKK